MRIALLLGSANVGGTELNTLRTVTALMRSGHEVTQILIGSPGSLVGRFVDTGASLVQVPTRSLAHPQILTAVNAIRNALVEARIQVAHSQDVFANIIGTPAARLARVPVVVTSRRWWMATPRRVHRTLNRAAYSLSTATVANAPSVATMLVRDEGLRPERVVVIPNLLDQRLLQEPTPAYRAATRAQLDLPDDATVIMCVARLMPVKNHSLLITAFATLASRKSNLRLVLVGGGALRHQLEAQAAELGLTGLVIFAGEREGGAALYGAADIAVLTSLSEGMPNSLLEAMACGLPVVSTAVGGCVDIVREGVTGHLVPSGDHEGLVTALASLAESPALRTQMGNAGRDMVLGTHTANSVIPQLESLYARLLASRE